MAQENEPSTGSGIGVISRITRTLYGLLEWAGPIVPGVVLALVIAISGKALASRIGQGLMGFEKSPISAIMVAIILGIVVRNTAGLPEVCQAGLRFSVRVILRAGIILLGLRLSLMAAGKLTVVGLPIVLGCIVVALLLVIWLGGRLKLPVRLSCLIAVGTSICGATAIVATGPVIEAEDDEVSYAVACITIFGILAMFSYPYLAYGVFGGRGDFSGMFLGTSIHETAQVIGAGLIYQQQYPSAETAVELDALNAATLIKLLRNVCMAGVIPLIGVIYQRQSVRTREGAVKKWYQMIPLFVIGFIFCMILRTVGDRLHPAVGLEQGQWEAFHKGGENAAKFLLTIAMAGVGLNTSIARLKNLGLKPFFVGLAAAVLVGGVSIGLVKLCGPLL